MDHVEQRDLADDGAEQVGALGDHGAHEQASVGAALDGEVILVGILFGDQVLGGGDHVIEDILFFVEHAGAVPVFAELGAAAQVGDGEDAAVLHPEISGAAEGGREADVEASVGGEQRGVVPIFLNAFFMHDEHGDAGAVFRLEPFLIDFIGGGIDGGSVDFGPERSGTVFQVVAVN